METTESFIRKKYPHAIIIFVLNGHCELEGTDASIVATLLDLPLSFAKGTLLAGFKQSLLEKYTQILVSNHNLSLAIADISNHVIVNKKKKQPSKQLIKCK